MIYIVHQLGLSEAELNDPTWADQAKELPDGSMMLIRDMNTALAGGDYSYYPEGDAVAVAVPGCPPAIADYYLNLFVRCDKFGLPSGRGWQDEPAWLLDYLIYMQGKKSEIESWMIRTQARGGRDALSPADFGGD